MATESETFTVAQSFVSVNHKPPATIFRNLSPNPTAQRTHAKFRKKKSFFFPLKLWKNPMTFTDFEKRKKK